MSHASAIIPRHGRLWLLFGLSVSAAFFILGFFGREVYRQAPPIPAEVRTGDGHILATAAGILTGQTVWQSTGGQQLGSIWGHGAYQAPDWTADWLHREAVTLLDLWNVRAYGTRYAQLDMERQGQLEARLKRELRTNTFDAATGVVRISPDRAEAMARVARHYDGLFGGAPALHQLRNDYAMQDVVVPDAARRAALTQFFFWTSWASATNRPGLKITYTNSRTSRSSTTCRRPATCSGRSSASCSCSPGSARWRGGWRSAAITTSARRRRRTTRSPVSC